MNPPLLRNAPKYYNFAVDSFDSQAFGGADGNRTALALDVGAGIISRYTFLDLAEYSNRLARLMTAKGVGPGDIVIMLMAPSGAAAIVMLAAMKIGAVAAPLPLDISAEFLSTKISHLGVGAVIGDLNSIHLVSAIAHVFPEIKYFSAAYASTEAVPELWTSMIGVSEWFESRVSASKDPALLLHHPDMPAGALYSHAALYARINTAEFTFRTFPTVGDVLWSVTDWTSDNGWIDAVLPSWHYGVPVIASPPDPADLDGFLTRWGVRVVHLPAKNLPQLQSALGMKRTPLRLLAVIGELARTDRAALREQFGRAFVPIFASPVFGPMLAPATEQTEGQNGAYGKPPLGYSLDVIDHRGRVLPAGEVGEIAILANEPILPLAAKQCRGCERIGRWLTLGVQAKRDLDGIFWPDPPLDPPPTRKPPKKPPPPRRLPVPNPKDRWT